MGSWRSKMRFRILWRANRAVTLGLKMLSLMSPDITTWSPVAIHVVSSASRSSKNAWRGQRSSLTLWKYVLCCWYTVSSPRLLSVGRYRLTQRKMTPSLPQNRAQVHRPRRARSEPAPIAKWDSLPWVNMPVPPHCLGCRFLSLVLWLTYDLDCWCSMFAFTRSCQRSSGRTASQFSPSSCIMRRLSS